MPVAIRWAQLDQLQHLSVNMPAFSEEQIIALAPDESSVKSGRDLANARKWVSFGASEKAVWGECQGSGSKPYQTIVDPSAPAFKCSCPSRKFPCKHGLGLMLLLCKSGSFENSDAPDWVNQWLQSRTERSEKKAKKAEESESTPDPAAKAKRQADRQAKVESGIAEFSLWMQDRIRQGLAGLENQSYQFWDGAAARLTDAQAPGLARQLRQCAGIPSSGEGWQARLLERLSMMHLATEGFNRIEELPEDLQQELRSIIGFTVSQDEVLKGSGVKDRWQVLGQRVEIEDRLKVQRTWLRGENSGQWALLLSFAFGMQPLDISLLPGTVIDAELVFFPASFKLRSLVKARSETSEVLKNFRAYKNADEMLDEYSKALSANPWLDNFPGAIESVTAGHDSDGQFLLVDGEKNNIPLSITDDTKWQMLALTGGHSFSIFGEWNGSQFLPVSLVHAGSYARLDVKAAAYV